MLSESRGNRRRPALAQAFAQARIHCHQRNLSVHWRYSGVAHPESSVPLQATVVACTCHRCISLRGAVDPPRSPGFRARHTGGGGGASGGSGGAFTTVDIGRSSGGGGMSNGLSPVPHSDPDRSPKGSASDRERRGGGMLFGLRTYGSRRPASVSRP